MPDAYDYGELHIDSIIQFHLAQIVDEQTQIKRLEVEIAGLKNQLLNSKENDALRHECEEKAMALEEARRDATALRKFLLSAATLQDGDISGFELAAPAVNKLEKRALARRRRTFDPAAFSTPSTSLSFGTSLHSGGLAPIREVPSSMERVSWGSTSSAASADNSANTTKDGALAAHAAEVEKLKYRSVCTRHCHRHHHRHHHRHLSPTRPLLRSGHSNCNRNVMQLWLM